MANSSIYFRLVYNYNHLRAGVRDKLSSINIIEKPRCLSYHMSCLAVPWHPPFSLHYQTARGLSACRPSSSSSFPPRSRPPADCLFLCSPTGAEAPLQETIKRERFSMRTNLHLALEKGLLWNLRCPAPTIAPGNVYGCSKIWFEIWFWDFLHYITIFVT